MTPLYVVDEIEAIVALVNTAILATIQANETAALGSTNIELISYHKGSYLELLETLQQKDSSNTQRKQKYPLVFVPMPFTEKRGRVQGVYADVRLRVLIIHQTEATYKVTDRYTNVFKPVLYPIYYEFLRQLAGYKGIYPAYEDLLTHDKEDLDFAGRNTLGNNKDGTLLNDYADVIDIQNLELKFYNKPISENC